MREINGLRNRKLNLVKETLDVSWPFFPVITKLLGIRNMRKWITVQPHILVYKAVNRMIYDWLSQLHTQLKQLWN